MIVVNILTILVFAIMWLVVSKIAELGREQKTEEMLIYIYILIFLFAVFAVLNITHLFA